MRLLVCGDRNWTDIVLIRDTMMELHRAYKIQIVIHGDAKGADRIAGMRAFLMRLPVRAFPANWEKYKKAAGPIRNSQMLDIGKPTHVLAFHDHIEKSKGTKDMLRKAHKAGLPYCIISHKRKEIEWQESSPNERSFGF